MEHVDTEAIDSWMGPSSVKRPLSKALGTEHVAINYYELAPGETFGFGYHRHSDQEEVFYVLEGVATFETDSDDVEVAPGEAIRFEPGEWQLGRNEGEDRVRALALGAPADSEQTELQRHCEDCDSSQPARIDRADDEDALVTLCMECGAETGRFY
jgi:uncharacterized cupin superfamily protein